MFETFIKLETTFKHNKIYITYSLTIVYTSDYTISHSAQKSFSSSLSKPTLLISENKDPTINVLLNAIDTL